MRIVTFNIHGWRTKAGDSNNFGRVVRVLSEIQPDIVGLNEVFHPGPQGPDGSDSPLSALAEKLGMEVVFGPCMRWPATRSLPERSYGNALLSRWPILASAAHHLADAPDKEQRGLLEARVLLPQGVPFTVYVTHLDHTDENARLVQLRSLHAWTVRDRNRPHIVMGDFNAVSPWDFADRPSDLEQLAAEHPRSGYLLEDGGMKVIPQMEKAGYVDAMRAAGLAQQGTFLTASVPLRIDYVFLSEGLAPALHSAQVWMEPSGAEASDHRPVIVDLDEAILASTMSPTG